MRLTSHQIETIHTVVASVTTDASAIRLFGSRLNDDANGGDIDLMIDLKIRLNILHSFQRGLPRKFHAPSMAEKSILFSCT